MKNSQLAKLANYLWVLIVPTHKGTSYQRVGNGYRLYYMLYVTKLFAVVFGKQLLTSYHFHLLFGTSKTVNINIFICKVHICMRTK